MTIAAAREIGEAIRQAKLAYEFNPGSYTFGAMSACMAAERALHTVPVDWIGEFLSHMESRQ